jgi:ABC-type transport system substrate-binding protein
MMVSKSLLTSLLLAFLLVTMATAQTEEPTTEPPAPTTTTAAPTTANPGQNYGQLCNGFLLKCNTFGGTVACTSRKANETVGGDTCEKGVGVDLGLCQCQRNCGADGIYSENGEFDAAKEKCVGLVGKTCSALVPDCTAHATCNLLAGVCRCQQGYVPDTINGLRCVPATTDAPLFR